MKIILPLLVLGFFGFAANAQDTRKSTRYTNLDYSFGTEVVGTTGGMVPFWMRTNKFGEIPLNGISAGFVGSVYRKYASQSKFNWGFGLNARANVGNSSNIQLIEAYLKVKNGAFQLSGGRTKDITGIVDSTLSSGAYSVSGNTFGIPKIEVSIPEYTAIPYTRGAISIMGNFNFGWIGSEPISKRSYTLTTDASTYFHQKSFYVRIGKPTSKIKLYGGFNHNVFWGDENLYFKDWNLSGFKTFTKVLIGGVHKQSKVGNHGGSIDQQITYDFNDVTIQAYHQFFYEVGGLAHLNNIKDGLFGFVVKNKSSHSERHKRFRWNKLLLEVLTSKSQGGELDAKVTPSGDEDYYNNYLYLNGWSYNGENLGNNFLTSKKYIRRDLPQLAIESNPNNRIYLLHFGADVDIDGVNVVGKLSFAKNFGTYGTSAIGNTTGGIRDISPPPYFQEVNQLSGSLELNKRITNSYDLGLAIAADKGKLLYDSFGLSIKIVKRW